MIEVNVHIYTDGDFVLGNKHNIFDEEFEYYSSRAFFNSKSDANKYIDKVFIEINNAKNVYNQHQGLINDLKTLNKNRDFLGGKVKQPSTAVYLAGNQEIEITVFEHTKTREEWLEQRITDIKEEYFTIYGTYPQI